MHDHDDVVHENVKQFLAQELTGVVSTIGAHGGPESALVYYTIDGEFNIYFTTYSNSRKYQNIIARPAVAFVVANSANPQTVQAEGVAKEMVATEVPRDILTRLNERMSMNASHFPPISHIKTERTVIIKITPTSMRYGDFAIVPVEGVVSEVFRVVIGAPGK